MTRLKVVTALAAAVFIASPAVGQAISEERFVVKNNSAETVRCTTRGGESWSPWFSLRPGQEWVMRAAAEPQHYLYCARPVRGVVYRLRRGERYSLLRQETDGLVILRRVSPDPE